MALKKGVCKNFDNCSLADNNEIQEVDSTEFKCQECGKDLHELEGKTKGTAGGNKKLPLIIAAAAVVLGGGGAGAYFGLNGKKDKAPVEDTVIEAVETPAPEQKAAPKATNDAPKQAASTTGSKNLGWANYSGPTQGGQPHGVGGTLKITTSYSIDLKDGRGTMLEVNAGETIENTKFENGRLRAGELHRADGTRKWFNI